jgi:CheY-like chemotaxis protein
MECFNTTIGLVVVLDETVMPGLARLAARNGWPIVRVPMAREALPIVLRRRAQMLVVQVSVPVDEAADLVRLLRVSPRKVPIIAVAATHNRMVEQAMREAGASCYLPDGDTPEALQQAITSMMPFEAANEWKGEQPASVAGIRNP